MRAASLALSICLALASLTFSARGAARPSDVEAEARSLLAAGVEQTVSPAAFAELGPELTAALLAIFERPTEQRYVRLRALSLLTHFHGERVTELFVRLVREGTAEAPPRLADALHPSRSSLVLRRAIEALAPRVSPDMTQELVRALEHRDPWVRRAAVLSLAQRPSAPAEEALAARLTREPSALVRKVLTDRSARPKGPRSNVPESAPPPR